MPAEREWPCPVCTELMPLGYCACPHCDATADWIDLLRSVDFSLRRFELWKLEGYLSLDEFRKIVAATRQYRSAVVASMHSGQPVPADAGLMSHHDCWKCGKAGLPTATKTCPECGSPQHTPEVRLLRYQTFVCHEVRRHQQAGRLSKEQWGTFLTDTPERQLELLKRIDAGMAPKRR